MSKLSLLNKHSTEPHDYYNNYYYHYGYFGYYYCQLYYYYYYYHHCVKKFTKRMLGTKLREPQSDPNIAPNLQHLQTHKKHCTHECQMPKNKLTNELLQ